MEQARRPRGWALTVLAALLLVWEPALFAWRASMALTRVADFGAPAVAFLMARVAVVGLGIAAGRALLAGERHGLLMARAFLVASSVAAVVTAVTPYLPGTAPPSERRVQAVLVLAYNGIWLLYLHRSRHVRMSFGSTEDAPPR